MSEIALKPLRDLRLRAKTLLGYVQSDLKPFLNQDQVTFRRKPDSERRDGDVNVTTTCSCLMALALMHEFESFYKSSPPFEKINLDSPDKAEVVFDKLIQASWMSSGISENNAFTTTLILRTYGFLRQSQLLSKDYEKDWEIDLGLKSGVALALLKKLQSPTTPAEVFLWRSMGEQTKLLNPTSDPEEKVRKALLGDLRRIVQSGWIYEKSRFPDLSPELQAKVDSAPYGNELVSVNRRILAETFTSEFDPPRKRSLSDIGKQMAEKTENFSINEYSPSAAVVYWFVDGIHRAKIELPGAAWTEICQWAEEEFNHQRSLVLAEHAAMMDPVAMAMSSCLCARLRRISEDAKTTMTNVRSVHLPSLTELEHSIAELFNKQSNSGIWPKYFPLFHYQDAGSNFCFTFELLEAVLTEFGYRDNHLLENPAFLEGLTRSVEWCERSLLKYSVREAGEVMVTYRGWNSGGNLKTLESEQPESWATAVVHMFLWELKEVLSQQIQRTILKKYKAKPSKVLQKKERESVLEKLMDVDIVLQDKPCSLIHTLKTTIVRGCESEDEGSLRIKPLFGHRSALLFGPPGTSKTEITKAIADSIGWPLLEITPSHFVRNGLDSVYLLADEIFEDLADLSGVVVFFDEMDALVQAREGKKALDIASQFLTTSMLPKLADLYRVGRVAFLMATNFEERFDPAIKRAGRFDLLLCMGPPSLEEKLNKIEIFYKVTANADITKNAKDLIEGFLKDKVSLKNSLELYTFGDFKSFITQKISPLYSSLVEDLTKLGKDEFNSRVEEFSKYVLLRRSNIPVLENLPLKELMSYDLDKLKPFITKANTSSEIGRYLLGRLRSRNQF